MQDYENYNQGFIEKLEKISYYRKDKATTSINIWNGEKDFLSLSSNWC